jgi:23S rRNA G2445 N2-methylase RlmL
VGESLRERHPEVMTNAKLRQHFHRDLFHGFDFDNTMLRIGSMNMLLHGVETPDVVYRDSLSQDHASEDETYTLVMANPPFAGSLDYESCAKDLQQVGGLVYCTQSRNARVPSALELARLPCAVLRGRSTHRQPGGRDALGSKGKTSQSNLSSSRNCNSCS